MVYLLTYLMVAGGTLAFTAAILGRYDRGETVILVLSGWQRLVLALGGLGLLAAAVALYSYQSVMDGHW